MPQAELKKPNKPPPPPPPPPRSPRLNLTHESGHLDSASVRGGERCGSEYAESSCSVPYSTRSLQPSTRLIHKTECHHSSCRSESSYSFNATEPSLTSCLGCSCAINNFPPPCCGGPKSCGCQPITHSPHCGTISSTVTYRPRIHSPCNVNNHHNHHSHGLIHHRHHPPACSPRTPFYPPPLQPHGSYLDDLAMKPLPPVPPVCHGQPHGNGGREFIAPNHMRSNETSPGHLPTLADSTTYTGNSYNNSSNNSLMTGCTSSSSGIGGISTTSSTNYKPPPTPDDKPPVNRIVTQAGLQTPLPTSDIPPPLPPMNPGLRSQPILNKLAQSLCNIPDVASQEQNGPALHTVTSPPHLRTQQAPMTSSNHTPMVPVQQLPSPLSSSLLLSDHSVPPRPLPPSSMVSNFHSSNLNSQHCPSESNNHHIQHGSNHQHSHTNVDNHRTAPPSAHNFNRTTEENVHVHHEMERFQKSTVSINCHKCGNRVLPNQDACRAMNQIYHASCFTCCRCNKTLVRETFWPIGNDVYCEDDYMLISDANIEKCAFCFLPIQDMKLPVLGKSYHPRCFKCCVCGLCLDGVPFTIDIKNKFYCIKDYHSLYSPKCAACGEPITPIDGTGETVRVVSQDKDYHIDCYCCEVCKEPLTDEEPSRSYPLDNHLLCQGCHIDKLTKMQASLTIA